MNLVGELIDDIVNPQISLSSILRKAKVLASSLRNEEFKKWIDNELNGYNNGEEIPDYRQFNGVNYGDFFGPFGAELRNAPIHTLILPEKARKYAEELHVPGGVRSLESLIESDSTTFQMGWPVNLVAIISDLIYEDYRCMRAWKSLERNEVDQILDTVRNRLLDFILELQKMYPEISSSQDAISGIPEEKVKSAFYVSIIGNENVVATGSHISQAVYQQIAKDDLNALLNFMKQIGIREKDIEELKKAIKKDGQRTELEKLGPKVSKWIGKIIEKVLDGSCKVAISAASTMIIEALFRYYGWR